MREDNPILFTPLSTKAIDEMNEKERVRSLFFSDAVANETKNFEKELTIEDHEAMIEEAFQKDA